MNKNVATSSGKFNLQIIERERIPKYPIIQYGISVNADKHIFIAFTELFKLNFEENPLKIDFETLFLELAVLLIQLKFINYNEAGDAYYFVGGVPDEDVKIYDAFYKCLANNFTGIALEILGIRNNKEERNKYLKYKILCDFFTKDKFPDNSNNGGQNLYKTTLYEIFFDIDPNTVQAVVKSLSPRYITLNRNSLSKEIFSGGITENGFDFIDLDMSEDELLNNTSSSSSIPNNVNFSINFEGDNNGNFLAYADKGSSIHQNVFTEASQALNKAIEGLITLSTENKEEKDQAFAALKTLKDQSKRNKPERRSISKAINCLKGIIKVGGPIAAFLLPHWGGIQEVARRLLEKI